MVYFKRYIRISRYIWRKKYKYAVYTWDSPIF